MRGQSAAVLRQAQGLIRQRVAEIHGSRLRIVAPLMVIVSLLFVVIDLFLLRNTADDGSLRIYLFIDLGLALFQTGATAYAYLRPPTVPLPHAYGYVTVVLIWAVTAGVVEFQRSQTFMPIIMTLFTISALGLFSAWGISLLILGTLGASLVVCLTWPGLAAPDLEQSAALFALALVAWAISRGLYTAQLRTLTVTLELQRANNELREARLNLIRQEKLASLGVLSAGIAHEVNNPLSFIKSNVTVLERNLERMTGDAATVEENRALLEETKSGFRRISEVVEALGTFGRDLPPGERFPYDLNHGIRVTLIMTRHENRGTVKVHTDLTELPLVPARGSEINQVLLNLLLNAFQAVRTLPDGVEKVVLIRTRTEPGFVVAEVSNNGPSIPADLRERIFEPFFSTKAPGSGMGLGLSLSWQIVAQRHGGDLELLDAESVTFRLRLPMSAPVSPAP